MNIISDSVRKKGTTRPGHKGVSRKNGQASKRLVCETLRRQDFYAVDYITVGLTGKLKIIEAKLVAIELGCMINSALYENGSTIEERAQNREIGLRLAEYLAHIFIDDKDEAVAFMRGIRQLVDEDIFIEKADYCRNIQDLSTFRSIPVTGFFGVSEFFWYDNALTTIAIHDKEVSGIINKAIDSLSDITIKERLKQFLDKFNLLQCTMTHNVFDDIQRVLDIHQKIYA